MGLDPQAAKYCAFDNYTLMHILLYSFYYLKEYIKHNTLWERLNNLFVDEQPTVYVRFGQGIVD